MKAMIRWFIENPVASNLLMIMILIGGLLSIPSTSKEFFPVSPSKEVQVVIAYPGAGPKEVEEQLCIRVEEAISDLDGIKEIRSKASLGQATITVEASLGYDIQTLLNDVKARVDAINTMPVDAERPQVYQIKKESEVLYLALSGNVSEKALKVEGEKLRDRLIALPEVAKVELDATRNYEISIDVSEQTLKRYNLTLDDVTNAISRNSLNLPAGSIRDKSGDIQIQTRAQAYTKSDFEQIPVRTNIDGSKLLVGDIATVVDGFSDSLFISHFNGEPGVSLKVSSSETPDVLKTSNAVQAFVKQINKELPPELSVAIWRDASYSFRLRLETLMNNGLGGLLLVFIVLVLFLRPALAFWVSVGIGVSFVGALWLLPYTPTSLNMISLFAFLLILGIIVDDAIIVGESIYAEQQNGIKGNASAVLGAQKVAKPILYAVVSTMIVFVPMYFLPGDSAAAAQAIPTIVILTLFFSLVESLFILPSHLAGLKPEKPIGDGWYLAPARWLNALRSIFASGLAHFASQYYRPVLTLALKWHWASIAIFISALMLVIAMFTSNWLKVSFLPQVASDYIIANATLPDGSPFSRNEEVLKILETSAEELKKEYQYEDELTGTRHSYINNMQAWAWDSHALVVMDIHREQRANVSVKELTERWNELIGEIPNLEDFSLDYTISSEGKKLQFIIASTNEAELIAASQALQKELRSYPGVYNISDSAQAPRQEIALGLKPEASSLGLTLDSLARQVRQGFYGAQAQRVPRGKEDVRVMVRYSKEERESVNHLDNIRIKTATGARVPFETVADIKYVPSYTEIQRVDRQRIVKVAADILPDKGDSNLITADVVENVLPELKKAYPSITLSLDGEQKDREEFTKEMILGALKAILVIYIIMAVAFGSYWQPVIILTAVPFGFMGAVIGHMVMGQSISIFSFLGILACAGVVVNDNLVLIDRINQLKDQKHSLMDALIQAGVDRFRPIILTSITTFIGLVPIMLETSLQAQFLIPMVISLAFGVLLATTITLLLVPCLYLVGGAFQSKGKEANHVDDLPASCKGN